MCRDDTGLPRGDYFRMLKSLAELSEKTLVVLVLNERVNCNEATTLENNHVRKWIQDFMFLTTSMTFMMLTVLMFCFSIRLLGRTFHPDKGLG